MFLSDADIKKAVKSGEIVISNFDESRLQPASYDILLGNKFIVSHPYRATYIDPVNKVFPKTHEIEVGRGEYFVLHPGLSILGYSEDHFGSNKYMVEINGKSSLARIGLLVHNSASLINPGHFLNVALELCNLNNVPILLRPGMPIGQLTFSTISSPVEIDYTKKGRYAFNNLKGYIPARYVPPTRKKSKNKNKKKR